MNFHCFPLHHICMNTPPQGMDAYPSDRLSLDNSPSAQATHRLLEASRTQNLFQFAQLITIYKFSSHMTLYIHSARLRWVYWHFISILKSELRAIRPKKEGNPTFLTCVIPKALYIRCYAKSRLWFRNLPFIRDTLAVADFP